MLAEKQFLFLREASVQLRHAVDASETFKKLQAEKVRPLWLFKALDDFIDHAARAATIFWPSKAKGKEKYQARGEELRALVGLDDDNPLHTNALRNRLQHFDENLEDWLSKPQSEAHVGDLCIDNKVMFDGKRIYGLREFCSEQNAYIFQGTAFPMASIEAAARELIGKIEALPQHSLGSLKLS
jgi:hypothetical protein